LLSKLLKVVPNPGHARQNAGSPGGLIARPGLQPPSTLPPATPFDVERHGVHVDPYTWTERGHIRGLRVTECGLDHPDGAVPTAGIDKDGGRVPKEVLRTSSGAPERPGPEAFTATHPKRTARRFDFPELRR
jgi:hypothetical protein